MVADNQSTEKDRLSPVETVRLEMSGHVRSLASPANPGESVKACIRRVSMRTGIGFGQVRRLWYGEWRVVPAHVADRLRKAAEAHERQIEHQLAARMRQSLAAMETSSDPEFYRPQIEAVRQLLFRHGDMGSDQGKEDGI